MYIFAKDNETGEVFEVLDMELYQGEVLFINLMDSNGSVFSVDYPENYEYTMQKENKEDEGNN